MATIKSYSDLEQSRKLAEILPIESADMSWDKEFDSGRWLISLVKYTSWIVPRYSYNKIEDRILPCWSLAALLSVLDFPSLTQNKEDEWEVCVPNHQSDGYIEVSASNPVDACVAMVEKLHELKLL